MLSDASNFFKMAEPGASDQANAAQKPENMDKQTLFAVLQFLKKNNLKVRMHIHLYLIC